MSAWLLVLAQAAAPPDFAAYAKRLEKACTVSYGTSNPENKVAAFDEARCARDRMNQELDRILLPLKPADRARFDALMREQAEWNRFAEAGCGLVEDMDWIDLKTGGRDWGTGMGFADAGCQRLAYGERAYMAAALRAKDAPGLARRVKELAEASAETALKLRGWREGIAPWAREGSKADLDAGQRPLEVEDAKTVAEAIAFVEAVPPRLAEASCRNWPQLADALGGPAPCVASMGAYYLQHLQ